MELRDIVFAICSDIESWIEYYQHTGDKEALDKTLKKITDLRTASFFILDETEKMLDNLEAKTKNDRDTIRRIFDI